MEIHNIENIILTKARKIEVALYESYDNDKINEIDIAEKRGAWCEFEKLLKQLDLWEKYSELYMGE